MKVLLAEETRLFEFRAIGGQVRSIMKLYICFGIFFFVFLVQRYICLKQVQISMRANDMFIGTVLKSLEIEDLVGNNGVSRPCYLARSFIGSSDKIQNFDNNDLTPSEGDDKFYEAPENLVDSAEYTMKSPQSTSEHLSSHCLLLSENLSFKTPSFSRIAGLLPDDAIGGGMDDTQLTETLDSFVKAQIVIYDQNSPLYNNVDKRVGISVFEFMLLTYFGCYMTSNHVNNCSGDGDPGYVVIFLSSAYNSCYYGIC